MTTRERIFAILRGEKPDRLPWLADLAYWIDYLNDKNIMPDKYLFSEPAPSESPTISQSSAMVFNETGLQKLHEDLGVGFYLQGYFPFTTSYGGDVKIEEQISRNPRYKTRITTISTPYGDMSEVWVYMYETHSWAPKEHLVKDAGDLKKIRYLYENTHYKPDYSLAERRHQSVGDKGVVLCYIQKCPIMEMIALRAGIEAVTYMIADDEEEWSYTLEVMEKKIDESCEIVLASPAECIMAPDNLSGESIGVNYYNRYGKPYHKKWNDRFRAAGKYSFVHLDGTIQYLITELCDAGFDVIEAITPAPVGSIPFEEIRPMMSDKAVIWGGIPGGFFHPSVDNETFDAFVISLIESMKRDGRSILAVGDQVVPGSSFERIARVEKLVEQYGYF